MNRKQALFCAKLILSLGILAWVYRRLIVSVGAAALVEQLAHVAWPWLWFGFAAQILAVGCSVLRWQRLLLGQGIEAPLRYLLGSFMIGRFFGEFAPGGWTGLNGYRVYDIAKRTGKLARSAAAIGVEMVLGWLSFGAVVVIGSLYGARLIGVQGVLYVDAFFIGIMAIAVFALSRPARLRSLFARLPANLCTPKLKTAIEALCRYEGQAWLLSQALALGVGTHVCRALIYIGAARALSANLSVGEVFFGSALQAFATLLPASINGIGLREATAVAVYTRGGVPESTAFWIATLGFWLEVSVSLLGGLFFVLRRRHDYTHDHDTHQATAPGAEPRMAEGTSFRRSVRGAAHGLGGGLLAGALTGASETALIASSNAAHTELSALCYGALCYAVCFGLLGTLLGMCAATVSGALGRARPPDNTAYARWAAGLFAGAGFAIAAFRVRRDYFHEVLPWGSPHGVYVLGACLGAATLAYIVLTVTLRALTARSTFAWLLRPWGTPLLLAAAALCTSIASLSLARSESAALLRERPRAPRLPAPASAGDILFIVVDTLRADHLPCYGYARGKTPALDRFAQDAVRFDAAFANASWTRPSFASLLTGRYPKSHRIMSKNDALPDELVTLPEVLRDHGYSTLGVVTNHNVAPFYNFHQGFDSYQYLEPDYVLGASDTSAKLLLVQALRNQLEKLRERSGRVEPGTAYQDAPTVNRAVMRLLDQLPTAPNPPVGSSRSADHSRRPPFFAFVAYMDPHDPYYAHPYDGTGYARAAHLAPKPEEAAYLIRLYDGEITFWDEHFGALLDYLKQRGLYDDLTIVVTSDHGEEFADHGGFWHGTTLYDEVLHVPLLIKLPAQAQRGGSVHAPPVQSIDLMPSLLSWAQLSIPPAVQGQDLFSPHDSTFAEESQEGNVLSSLRLLRAGETLKLIHANPGNPRGLAPVELYQVDRDPLEQVNVAGEQPELLSLTRDALNAQAQAAERGHAAKSRVSVALDEIARERLRALGYAGADTVE